MFTFRFIFTPYAARTLSPNQQSTHGTLRHTPEPREAPFSFTSHCAIVGFCEQEFLVDGRFAFFNVLPIFFGLFVDFSAASGQAMPPSRVYCVCGLSKSDT